VAKRKRLKFKSTKDKAESCSLVCWDGIGLGGLQAGYKKKDKTLDGQPAYGNVGGSYQYSERRSNIDFGS
jgi:hypothetical protein